MILKLVSKPQIMFEGKAQDDEKAESAKALWRMSKYILNRLATQLADIRWGFETSFKDYCRPTSPPSIHPA